MNCFKPVVLCFLIGCATSGDDLPSYGAPTETTAIHMVQVAGFSPAPSNLEVHIEGTAVMYRHGNTTGRATIAIENVAAIIHALEAVEFLELDASYSTCEQPASDAPAVTIDVALSAGSQMVSHYVGCSGGVFDDLKRLDQQIYELSGFNAWFEQL
jgi:hypothetical protein